MSADNGIYIARFPRASGGYEWRVAHCQNIEDTEDNSELWSQGVTDHIRITKFGNQENVTVFETVDAAFDYAVKLSNVFPILEYGIGNLDFDRPLLDKTVEQAEAWLEEYFQKERDQQEARDLKEETSRNQRTISMNLVAKVTIWDGEDGLPDIRWVDPVRPSRKEIVYQVMKEQFFAKYGNYSEFCGGEQNQEALFPHEIRIYHTQNGESANYSVSFQNGVFSFTKINSKLHRK